MARGGSSFSFDDIIGIVVFGGIVYFAWSSGFFTKATNILKNPGTLLPAPSTTVRKTTGGGTTDLTGGAIAGGGGTSLGRPGGGNDRFGVKMIYASNSNNKAWYLSGPSGIYNSGNKIVSNGDGSFSNSGSNVRNEVCTPGFPRNSFGNPDHNVIAQRGYMYSPRDWGPNFEMTGYWAKGGSSCASAAGQSGHMEYVMGGGVNDGHGCGPVSCQATNYHLNLYPTGRCRLERDLCHNTGYQANAQESSSGVISSAFNSGRFFGYKGIKRTVGGAVQLEFWLDPQGNNNWQKVFTGVDHGQLGCRGVCCCKGCNCNRPVTWAGPCVNFRFDGMCMKWKWLSLRDIA